MRFPSWPYALTGVLAALAGAGMGHLTAAFVDPAASPVLAVGSTVIDATPTPVKEWAVRTMGTSDKPILIGSVTLGALLLTALAGIVMHRHRTTGLLMLVGLVALAGAAAISRPSAGQLSILPALVTALVGLSVATWLLGRIGAPTTTPAATPAPTDNPAPAPEVALKERPKEGPATYDATRAAASYGDVTDGEAANGNRANGKTAEPPRRQFLIGAAGVAVLAAASVTAGTVLGSTRTPPALLTLPKPSNPLPAPIAGLEGRVNGITPLYVPNKDFYRIDTALVVPNIDPANWELTIDGDVDNPFTLTFDEFMALPMVEADITLTCVSNEVGGPYVGGARWLGVPVRTLLERAGVRSGVDQILSTSVDGMTISTPVQALTDDRDALLAVGMNGAPLPREHGYPVRMVTPGLFGFVGCTKWVTKLTATTYAKEQAYWTRRGWATDGTIHTEARIDTPRGLASLKPGKVIIGGVAWAQHRGLKGVEVRVDDGPWQPATMGPDAGIDMWQQWFLEWDATEGRHDLSVRATDATNTPQTDQRAEPFPAGATGLHTIIVTVNA